MKLTEVDYGDFVMWSDSELVIIRIAFDGDFINSAIEKATVFFKHGVLPELLGKWYTKPPVQKNSSECITSSHNEVTDYAGESSEECWCYCRGEDIGEMILCDNERCEIKWFHTSCLRITKIPKGSWFCPDCIKDKKKIKNK